MIPLIIRSLIFSILDIVATLRKKKSTFVANYLLALHLYYMLFTAWKTNIVFSRSMTSSSQRILLLLDMAIISDLYIFLLLLCYLKSMCYFLECGQKSFSKFSFQICIVLLQISLIKCIQYSVQMWPKTILKTFFSNVYSVLTHFFDKMYTIQCSNNEPDRWEIYARINVLAAVLTENGYKNRRTKANVSAVNYSCNRFVGGYSTLQLDQQARLTAHQSVHIFYCYFARGILYHHVLYSIIRFKLQTQSLVVHTRNFRYSIPLISVNCDKGDRRVCNVSD